MFLFHQVAVALSWLYFITLPHTSTWVRQAGISCLKRADKDLMPYLMLDVGVIQVDCMNAKKTSR